MISVFGYFNSLMDAQRAENKLRNQGFDRVYLDIVDKLLEEPIAGNIDSSIPPTVSGIASLVLKGGDLAFEKEFAPLLAADPNVSGMSGTFEENVGANIVLKVFIDKEEQLADVKNVIKENNGNI